MAEPGSPNPPSVPPSPPDSPGATEYVNKAFERIAAQRALEEKRYIFIYPELGHVDIEDLRPPDVELDGYYVFEIPPPYSDHEDRWDLYINNDRTEVWAENPSAGPRDADRARGASHLGTIDLVVGRSDRFARRAGDVKTAYLKKRDVPTGVNCSGPRERVPDEERRRFYEEAGEDKTEEDE
ncbi:hypothetical protein RB595_000491 [Gaeumannomyces hyphopodioides]